jgi:phospholipid/cholesterol/gamma-HCH transport system ATP-binding protein
MTAPDHERPPTAPDVRCTELTVTLGGKPVLRGVDLYVPAGGVTALVGASGSGKTTLVKHLLGLRSPDQGTVTIGGQDVWASTPAELLELRRNLSALHGGPTVYEGSVFASLSVRDNLLAVLHEKRTHPAGDTGKIATANPYLKLWVGRVGRRDADPELLGTAQRWLDRLDLVEVADQGMHEVSAGLRRRAALGAALAVDAQLYVLDDPDGAIDAIHRKIVVDALLDAHARTGATMLIVTHDIELALAVADRVAVLSRGRIVFDGDPDEALHRLREWYGQEDVPLVRRTPPARRSVESASGGTGRAPSTSSVPGALASAILMLVFAAMFVAMALVVVYVVPRG